MGATGAEVVSYCALVHSFSVSPKRKRSVHSEVGRSKQGLLVSK